MKYLTIWLVSAIAIAILLTSQNVPTFRRLATRGVEARGIVLELHPEIHATLTYKYQVGGSTFRGQTQPWPPNPPLQQIKVGQEVVIYYDPEHPEVSALGDPHLMLNNEISSVVLGAIGLPTFLVIVLKYRNFKIIPSRKSP